MINFPVIKGNPDYYPTGDHPRSCPICGQLFKKQVVYIRGGAYGEDIEIMKTSEGFLSAGVHQIDSGDGDNDQNTEIVYDSKGGQFYIAVCSTDCLRRFFLEIVETLNDL